MKVRTVAREACFWLHGGVVVLALMIGLFVPLWLWVMLAVGHRVHAVLLDGCALSKLERKLGGIASDQDYLQTASRRLFGTELSRQHSRYADYTLAVISAVMALVGAWLNPSAATILSGGIIAVGLVGLSDASTITFAKRARPVCRKDTCDRVLWSRYGSVGPMPISLIGMGFFTTVIATAGLVTMGATPVEFLIALATVGAGVSAILVFMQAQVIRSWCRMCLISAGSATAIFGLSLYLASVS